MSEDRVFTCPECGRYIGPVMKCPYCGRRIEKSRPVLALKYGALAMAFILTFVFWFAMTNTALPEVSIGDISKSMNYSRVTIKGIVPGAPKFYPNEYTGQGTLYFDVDDGTGIITVVAYDTATREMIDHGNIPSQGDSVIVSGTVRWRGSDLKLILSTDRQLAIERAVAAKISIDEIDRGNMSPGDVVAFNGTVTSHMKSLGFAYKFNVGDGNSSVEVMIYNSTIQLYGKDIPGGTLDDIRPGTNITVYGVLDYYFGWNVIAPRPSDIRLEVVE